MTVKYFTIKDSNKLKGCVLTYGHFNSIHPGHIRYLRFARALGNSLIVALIGDQGLTNFQFNQKERADGLSLLGILDGILLLNENELDEAVKKIEPNNLVLGLEFKENSDKNILNSIAYQKRIGKKVLYHAGDINYANDNLLKESERSLIDDRKIQFINACNRQKIKSDSLIDSLNSYSQSKIVVLGDTIVDQYIACEALGMSAEAPVIVVKEISSKNFIGGAAIVAAHIKSLGAKCDLVSIVGEDETSNLVISEINKIGVGSYLVKDPDRPTTFKKRYVVDNQKLFRVSKLESFNASKDIEDLLIANLESSCKDAHCIVVSDFVYGVVTKKVLEKVHQLAKKHNLFICGDIQCSSQNGKLTKFKNFSLLCPNEKEARIALEDQEIGLEKLSRKIIQVTSSQNLVMKLGPDGLISYEGSNKKEDLTSQSFPALTVNPVDVTGAGDSLLAVMACGIASHQPFMFSSAIACCISSLAVQRMGNIPISKDELKSLISELVPK
tara:strand:+ start:1092 stop:2588 length:1497 start_codon:yes stop_codon:yes gene_type:complete